MKYSVFILGAALSLCAVDPAAAAKVSFGCESGAPNVCYFRIFYARGDRVVILPAGMKTKIPGVTVGRDGYCVDVGKAPRYKCVRKLIGANYNS
jgi:hypothetical protein